MKKYTFIIKFYIYNILQFINMDSDNLDSEIINIKDFNTSKNKGDLFHICSKVYDNMKL